MINVPSKQATPNGSRYAGTSIHLSHHCRPLFGRFINYAAACPKQNTKSQPPPKNHVTTYIQITFVYNTRNEWFTKVGHNNGQPRHTHTHTHNTLLQKFTMNYLYTQGTRCQSIHSLFSYAHGVAAFPSWSLPLQLLGHIASSYIHIQIHFIIVILPHYTVYKLVLRDNSFPRWIVLENPKP